MWPLKAVAGIKTFQFNLLAVYKLFSFHFHTIKLNTVLAAIETLIPVSFGVYNNTFS